MADESIEVNEEEGMGDIDTSSFSKSSKDVWILFIIVAILVTLLILISRSIDHLPFLK